MNTKDYIVVKNLESNITTILNYLGIKGIKYRLCKRVDGGTTNTIMIHLPSIKLVVFLSRRTISVCPIYPYHKMLWDYYPIASRLSIPEDIAYVVSRMTQKENRN